MCHGHSQVAASQAGRDVMSRKGSGQAAGQEWLPLRLLRPAAAPFLSPSPLAAPALPPRLPATGRAASLTSHGPYAPGSPKGGFP